MASTRNTRPERSSADIALEIVKAALAGGAIRPTGTEAPGEPLKAVTGKAALDAVYAVRLYQNVLARLEKPRVTRQANQNDETPDPSQAKLLP